MSNRKPEHYTYTRLGKAGSTVTRDADGATLGAVYRVNRLGGGHMWQARPVGAVPGEERITFQPTKLEGAVYLDAMARVEARTYAVGDEVLYDTGQGFSRTATVTEDGCRDGWIAVTGTPSRIRLRNVAKAMMKRPLPELTPNAPEA